MLYLTGILIGLIFGLPAGAVGVMTIQRTLRFGMKGGLITGLGSSAADCVYACIGAFGITLVSDFLLEYQLPISLIGSGLIIFMGVRLIKERASNTTGNLQESYNKPRFFLSAFCVTITNPTAILTFLFAFSWFGISGNEETMDRISLVAGVFAGTFLWWLVLSALAEVVRKKANHKSLRKLNRLFGVILLAFAAIVLVRTLFQFQNN